jgi:hypothetical protein
VERGARLRAVANKKFSSAAEYNINYDRNCIVVVEYEARDDAGKPRKVLQPGTTVELTALAPVNVRDVVALVRPNPNLYTMGYVNRVLPLISPSDGDVVVSFEYTAKERTDLSKLDYLFELYLGE